MQISFVSKNPKTALTHDVGSDIHDHRCMKEKENHGDEFIGPRPSYEPAVPFRIVINVARDEIEAGPPYKRGKNGQADEGEQRINPASPMPRDVRVRPKSRSLEFRC